HGKGVHSGAPASLTLHPASRDIGIRFLVSKRGRIIADIPADVRFVKNLTLCTVLGDDEGTQIGTVEHLLAALSGLGIDNCYVEVDSHEVPIMDGSSAAFVEAIDAVGLRDLAAPRRFIKILKPVRVDDGDCWGELAPHNGFKLDVEIDFDTDVIGRQRLTLDMAPDVFRRELSRARTFGFMRDVEQLWKMKLALGASLENSVAIGDDKIINPEGLRYEHEFVRHKMLDAIGDLSLAGAPILGAYRSVRGGHRLNAHVLQAVLADETAWTTVHAPQPVRVAQGARADASSAVAAVANFAADRT
ncbi:MAG: UDP-3-O-acyl-N-acetylglucosamine deacetylase, partial [Pseudomonadota bacterium]